MTPSNFSISKYLPVLLLLFFLSFFARLESIPLFDPDEGLYSEVTREMMANNDYTQVQLNGAPFIHKPPLFYWIQAASIKVLGLNEFGLRLPSAIAAFFWTVSIFLFTRRYYDTMTAWYAGLFMAASPAITLAARAATPAALFNLFLTLTLLNIFRFSYSGNKRNIYWSFMFAGLGILTNGPAALVIPAAVSMIYFGISNKWRALLSLFGNPTGLTVLGLIVIPWYLGEYLLNGETFLIELFLLPQKSFEPYNLIGGSISYFFYPAVLFIGLLPFSGMLLKAFFYIKKSLSEDLVKFLLIWSVVSLALFPLIQPKSLLSLTYCCSPLVILMAGAAKSLKQPINVFIWPLMLLGPLLVLLFLAPHIAGSSQNVYFRSFLTENKPYFDNIYQLMLAAVFFLLAILPFLKTVPAPLKYALLALLFVGMINFLILPITGNILQKPVKTAALMAKRKELKVITWGVNHPSFNVYAERLTEIRPPVPGDIVLARSEFLADKYYYDPLFSRHGLALVRIMGKQGETK